MNAKILFALVLVIGLGFSECMSQLLRLKHGEYFVLGPFTGRYQYDVVEGSTKYAVFKLWHDSEPSYVKAKLYQKGAQLKPKVFFTTETAEMLTIDRFVLSSTNGMVFNITYCWNMTNISTPIPVLMHRYDYLVTTEGESGVGMMLDDFSDIPDVSAIVSFCDKNLECEFNGVPIKDQIREGETERIYVPGFGDIYVHNYDTNIDEGFAILGMFPYNAWGKQIYKSESISVENKQTQSAVSKLPSKITIAK